MPDRRERTPLVLLSGMLGDRTLWDGVVAPLAGLAQLRPARIDRADSVPELAAAALAEAPARFALAGHSLGGIVALEVVRQAPERVLGLALLNASARPASSVQLAAWSVLRRRTLDGAFGRVADELAAATLGPSHRSTELVERSRRMADAVGAAGFLRQLAAQASRPDSRAARAAVAGPVLVLSGELDDVCPPFLQQELAGLFAAAQLVTVPGAGHMLPLEDPEALAALLREWLAGVGE